MPYFSFLEWAPGGCRNVAPVNTAVDWQASRHYHDRLVSHLTGRLLSRTGEFVCPSSALCSASAQARGFGFAGGQLSYVGDAYACSVGRYPLRLLVVSMQVGDAESPVTMARRTEQIMARVPERPGQRNPHMRGVTRALQLLHGLSVDTADEHLADGTHVLRAFAMANSTLCSALPTGGKSRRGRPTDAMLEHCAQYLEATILTLEPTVLQVQGADTLAAIDRLARTIEPFTKEVAVIELMGRQMLRCATSHPAAGPPVSWSSLQPGSYFANLIAPSLQLTRELALGGQVDSGQQSPH